MNRWLWTPALLTLIACGGDGSESGAIGDLTDWALDPAQDNDGDGISNGEEEALGSNPMDAEDVPYKGGWAKDSHCNETIVATGDGVGQIAADFALVDQFGDTVHLHDFCGRVVLIEFSGFS